jgi:hypothetical protein
VTCREPVLRNHKRRARAFALRARQDKKSPEPAFKTTSVFFERSSLLVK